MNNIKWFYMMMLAIAVLAAACGGGGGGGGSDPAPSNSTTTYSISGTVTSSGTGTQGVSVSLSGANTAVATTDASGNYTFTGLANGAYMLTPSKAGYAFSPAEKSITINNANSAGITFIAVATTSSTYSITGTVTLSGAGLSGATITLSGANSATAMTDSNGNFTLNNIANGSCTITPSKTGYSFSPVNKSVTINNTNSSSNNFIANIAAGSLDATFHANGIVTTAFGTRSASASAVAIQADGKIVVAGSASDETTSDFALARYNTDGSLDTTFNATGKVITSVGIGKSYANAVAIQSDGKIVVAGGAEDTPLVIGTKSYGFALARYNTDGSLDTTFNTTGKIVTFINFARSDANALAIQSNGKIVVAGYSDDGTASFDVHSALARYNTDGSLDTTFGTAGKVNTSAGVMGLANAVAIQTDGKIVTAGSSWSTYYRCNRFNVDGSLDMTFGTAGSVTTYFSYVSPEVANAVVIQLDGRILAAGSGGNDGFALSRYNPNNGTADATFGIAGLGKSTTIIDTGNDIANGVAIQSDGKIVAIGTTYNGLNSSFALLRTNANGISYDLKVTTAVGTTNSAFARAVALQADGKILAIGGTGGTISDFALVRYWP